MDLKRVDKRCLALLPMRLVLFFCFQTLAYGIIILVHGSPGTGNAWHQGAAWWPFAVTTANVVCWNIMHRSRRTAEQGYCSIIRGAEQRWNGSETLWSLGILAMALPVALLPNALLSKALFGSTMTSAALMFRPLPPLALAVAAIMFPISQGLVELPWYFLFTQRRLAASGMHKHAAWGTTALALSLEHVTVPLLFDGRFILWRALMYLPFSCLCMLVIERRPIQVRFLMGLHIAMDASAMLMYMMV